MRMYKTVLICSALSAFLAFSCASKETMSVGQGQTQTPIAAAQGLLSLSHAEQLIIGKRYQEAVDIVTHVIESEGQSAYALTLRGVCWAKLNKPHFAFTDLIEATRIDYSSDTLVNIGNAERMFGHCERAADAYNKALILQPNDFQILVNLGSAYACYGESELSLAALDKARVINPNNEILWTNYAITYIGQGNFIEAQKAADMAISLNPSYFPIYKAKLQICKGLEADASCFTTAKDNYEKYKPAERSRLR